MPNNIPNLIIHENQWVDLYDLTGIAVGTILNIENSGTADVYLAIQATKPEQDHRSFNVIKRAPSVNLRNNEGDAGAWAYCPGTSSQLSISTPLKEGFIPTESINLNDSLGNPIKSFNGAINIHDADVHTIPINELFHRHVGTGTTITTAITPGDTSINIVSGVGFSNGDPIQIENGVIETTFPTIISGGGTNTFILDRPIDNAFDIGDSVELVSTNMAVVGSISSPVAFRLIPDLDQEWHIYRFLLAMIHSSSADDSLFGNLPELTNGCVLRGYNGAANLHRTFTNWKRNSDIKMDMYDLDYTDKAGGGRFGVNGRGSIKIGTGAAPHIHGINGDYLELLIQDDLTGLEIFQLKGQGHVEGT